MVARSVVALIDDRKPNSASNAPSKSMVTDVGAYGFWSRMIFLGVLTVGFIYEWKKGALEWD